MESEPSHGPTLRKNIRRHASDFPGKRQQWRSHAVFADCYLERLRGRNADRGWCCALRATKSTWRDYIGGTRLRQCCRSKKPTRVESASSNHSVCYKLLDSVPSSGKREQCRMGTTEKQ